MKNSTALKIAISCALAAIAIAFITKSHAGEDHEISVDDNWKSPGMNLYLASIEDPDADELLDIAQKKASRAQAEAILLKLFPTPTPWPDAVSAEVRPSGNVLVKFAPRGVFVAGKAPIEIIPPDCRDDFRSAPSGTTVICMRQP